MATERNVIDLKRAFGINQRGVKKAGIALNLNPSEDETRTGCRFIEAFNDQAKTAEEAKYPELQDSGQDLSGKWMIPCQLGTVDKNWNIVKRLVEEGFIHEAKVACTNSAHPEGNCIFVYVYNSEDIQAVARTHNLLREADVLDDQQTIEYKTNRATLDGKYGPDTVRYTSAQVKLFNESLASLSDYTSPLNRFLAWIKSIFSFGIGMKKLEAASQLKTEIETSHSTQEILNKIGQHKTSNNQIIATEKEHAYFDFFKSRYNEANIGEFGKILNNIEDSVKGQKLER